MPVAQNPGDVVMAQPGNRYTHGCLLLHMYLHRELLSRSASLSCGCTKP